MHVAGLRCKAIMPGRRNMKVTHDVKVKLNELKLERKFIEEDFYPGAPTEEIRVACEKRVNAFIEKVVFILDTKPEAAEVLALSEELERSFRTEDTEEREKVGDYICEVLRILDIDVEP
jgi:hypothetical protein